MKGYSCVFFAPSSLLDLYKNTDLMWKQSVWTSTISSHLAALHLKEGGLLTLAGAKAALSGTGGEPLPCVPASVFAVVVMTRKDRAVTLGSASGSVIQRRVYLAGVFVGWPPKSNSAGNRKRCGAAAEEGRKKLTHLSDTWGSRAASLGGRGGVDKMDPGKQKGEMETESLMRSGGTPAPWGWSVSWTRCWLDSHNSPISPLASQKLCYCQRGSDITPSCRLAYLQCLWVSKKEKKKKKNKTTAFDRRVLNNILAKDSPASLPYVWLTVNWLVPVYTYVCCFLMD